MLQADNRLVVRQVAHDDYCCEDLLAILALFGKDLADLVHQMSDTFIQSLRINRNV